MSQNRRRLPGSVKLDTFGVPVFPSQIGNMPDAERTRAVAEVRKAITTRLRILHFLLGSLGILFAALILTLTITLDGAVGNYLSCFYTAFGTPTSSALLKIVANGCVTPFLIASVTLALYAILYHLVLVVMQFEQYTRMFFGGVYDNPYRWVARAWAEPVFLLLALEASGMRNLVTIVMLMLLQSFAEYMRFASESSTEYVYNRNEMRTKISERGRNSLHGAAYLSAIVVLGLLVAWIAFIAQDAGNVPLITWLYAPAYVLYHIIYAFWAHIAMLPGATKYGARARLEFYWDIYIFFSYTVLTVLATIGSIYTLQ